MDNTTKPTSTVDPMVAAAASVSDTPPATMPAPTVAAAPMAPEAPMEPVVSAPAVTTTPVVETTVPVTPVASSGQTTPPTTVA